MFSKVKQMSSLLNCLFHTRYIDRVWLKSVRYNHDLMNKIFKIITLNLIGGWLGN